MTPYATAESATGRPVVILQCLADRPTVGDNLRVDGVVVIDPADPLLMRPGDRLRLVVDRPGWGRPLPGG